MCIFLGKNKEPDHMGEFTFRIYHPIEGYIESDNSYYYITIEQHEEMKSGYFWKEIENNEVDSKKER
tara:strand:- start:88 stop:288 length:201 start_codon:yes stop_codon:yes gene_type:complete